MKKKPNKQTAAAAYFDRRGVLGELEEKPVEFALEEVLREKILKGQRKRRLKRAGVSPGPPTA